jgi:hypothetical protein
MVLLDCLLNTKMKIKVKTLRRKGVSAEQLVKIARVKTLHEVI